MSVPLCVCARRKHKLTAGHRPRNRHCPLPVVLCIWRGVVILPSMADSAISAPSPPVAAATTTQQPPATTTQQPPPNAVRKPSRCFSSIRSPSKGADAPSYYSFDAEMVTVKGPGELPERRAMVSVGVVNERLETVLYARVAVPNGCHVTDGAFARAQG